MRLTEFENVTKIAILRCGSSETIKTDLLTSKNHFQSSSHLYKIISILLGSFYLELYRFFFFKSLFVHLLTHWFAMAIFSKANPYNLFCATFPLPILPHIDSTLAYPFQ